MSYLLIYVPEAPHGQNSFTGRKFIILIRFGRYGRGGKVDPNDTIGLLYELRHPFTQLDYDDGVIGFRLLLWLWGNAIHRTLKAGGD